MSSQSGRKILPEYENPVDNILIEIADSLAPSFKHYGLTPNMITGLSAIFGILCLYFYHRRSFIHAGVCFFIQYFFDCMDGFYARKYKMTSKMGDLYDHVKDAMVNAGLLYMFYRSDDWIGISLLLITTICVSVQLGCQEVMYNSDESPTLSFTKQLAPCTTKDESHAFMPYVRWIGCGTWNLVMALYIMSRK